MALDRAESIPARIETSKWLCDRQVAARLAKAFRGELVTQDPADEPAQSMLDRLRSERAAEVPDRRTGRCAKA